LLAPDAVQRVSGALLIRGPSRLLGPGSALRFACPEDEGKTQAWLAKPNLKPSRLYL